jgi:hypothetical protein
VDEVLGKEEIGLAREEVNNLGAETDQIGQQKIVYVSGRRSKYVIDQNFCFEDGPS